MDSSHRPEQNPPNVFMIGRRGPPPPPPLGPFSGESTRRLVKRTPPLCSLPRVEENPLLGFCFRRGPPRAAAGGVFRRVFPASTFPGTEGMTAKLFPSSFHIRDQFWVR